MKRQFLGVFADMSDPERHGITYDIIKRPDNFSGKLMTLLTGRNFYFKKWKSGTERGYKIFTMPREGLHIWNTNST